MSPVVHEMTVQELARRITQGEPVYLLDVRQPWEFSLAALPESHLVPLDHLPGRIGEIHPPDEATIVVYCHHGIRSRAGAALLQRAGRTNVVSLAGGIDAWSLQVDPAIPRY